MLNSWFSSRSSRHRKTPSNPPPAADDVHSGPSDTSSISQTTTGPLQTPGNLTSKSDVPLDEVHTHVNDLSVYAPTPSLIHSTEKEAGTLRTSDVPASLEASTYRPDSTKQVSERTPFTPQDAIIAHVFGKSVRPATDPAHAAPPPSSSVPQPSVSLTMSDSAPTPASVRAPRARPGPTVTIYDPFSGAKIGEHTPMSMSPSTATPGELANPAPLPTADDRRLWSSLERILELQAEIAAMHADMEGVGGRGSVSNAHAGGIASVGAGEGGNAGRGKRLRRGQTLPVGDEEPEEHETESGVTGKAVSEISTDHTDGGDNDDDDDDDDDDEDGVYGYGKRRRDEEFARLADQFAQRKTAIGGIMNKLDALSTALKTFHTLPPPLFDLALSPPRTDTMSSALSNVSAAPSPPPLHAHPVQPSFSLSSVSPSQAGHLVTPPTASLSPPVPPISILAPPVSSGDLSAPPGHAPVVTPALPQMTLPTIIPGAPHVESPADGGPSAIYYPTRAVSRVT